MFAMMIFIAVSATMLEMMIVYKSPALRRLIEKRLILGLAFSVFIVMFSSVLFGTGGTIIGGAAFLSTMMSFVLYNIRFLDLVDAVLNLVRTVFTGIATFFHAINNAWSQTKHAYNTVRHPIQSRKVTS